MLAAYLTDRTPLTSAIVRRRIQAGAPMYGTSPDRPVTAQRRVPYASLSPEAYGALASLPVRPMQAGAPTRFVQDDGAIYTQGQKLLVLWRKGGGPCMPADFGDDPTDTGGNNTPRTQDAVLSFQRWANATSDAGLRSDGTLDDVTLGQLVIVTAPAAQAQSAGAKSMWPWWVVGAAALGIVAYEYSGSTKHVARSR